MDLQTRQKHIEDYAEMQLETKRKEELKRQKAIEVKARLDEQVASARQQHCRDAALSSTETLLNKVCVCCATGLCFCICLNVWRLKLLDDDYMVGWFMMYDLLLCRV